MKIKLTDEELRELRLMASAGSACQPKQNTANALAGLGFAEPDSTGGLRISAEGRKYLRDTDADSCCCAM